MLEVERKPIKLQAKEFVPNDIIIKKITEKITYTETGYQVQKEPIKINLTKKINESKKLLKQSQAQIITEKLSEIEKIMTK